MRFTDATIPQLQEHLRAVTPEWVAVNAAYAKGDHWQGGAGWIGPLPVQRTEGYEQAVSEIARAFVSKNAIKEIEGRHVGGCIGREPVWGLTVKRPLKTGKQPTRAEQALIDEAEALLTAWWDERGVHALFQKLVATALRSARAPTRLYVPSGLRDKRGRFPQSDLPTAMSAIYPEALPIGDATLLIDDATMQQAGVYVYRRKDTAYAELSFVSGGKTVLRVLDGSTDTRTDYALPLGGRLWHHELQRDVLITEQVRQNQMLLNLARTMLGRNVVQGGFLERIVLNGQLPGKHIDDPSSPTGKRFVATPFQVGAGTTNFITGTRITDPETGEVRGYATPSVIYRDPVVIATFTGTAADAYRAILEECQQVHALLSGDANASGESRRQALADFLSSLLLTIPALQRLGRWLLETALALAAVLAGQPGRFDSLRATFECRIDTGPISADELRLIIELVAAKLLSKETAMARIGVEDVDAELARIAAEAEAAQTRTVALITTTGDKTEADKANETDTANDATTDATQGVAANNDPGRS